MKKELQLPLPFIQKIKNIVHFDMKFSLTFMLFLLFFAGVANGQTTVSQYSFSMSTGTYTDISTTGTNIPIGAGDEVAVGGLPIGFTFTYHCIGFSTFGITTNGFLRLGATPPTGSNSVNYEFAAGSNATDSNTIGGLAADLYDMYSNAGRIWYQTIGTPGSRICTVEWQHMYFWGAAGDYSDDANFQIQLFEGTNVINIVYGNSFETNHYSRMAQVGLRGVDNTDYNLIDDAVGTLQWNAVTATTTGGNTLRKTWGINNTNEPGLGLTYTWTPPITSCTPLAIGEIKNENFVSVFPNPFSESTTISVQGGNVSGKKTISILDITGKEIITVPMEGNTYTVSKNSLAEGMYLFFVKNEKDELIGNGKLIVK